MRISIVGTGYVGLVTGTCLAEIGHNVICVDIDEEKIRMLKNNQIPIYEPGLEILVPKNSKEGRLHFTTEIKEGVENSDVIFIAVGTPPKETGEADLSYIEAVSREIAYNMRSYKVVVEKSTVPVKTGEWVKRTIKYNNKHNVDFDVVSNPEFLREGSAVMDFMNPDRIVVGVRSERAANIMKEVYQPIIDRIYYYDVKEKVVKKGEPSENKIPFLITDINSAELIKHASNSFLALKISYINAVANICELANANVEEVALGMGLDKRIGKEFLKAGVGFGGSCFPKDVIAFYEISRELGYDFKILKEVLNINKKQREIFVRKIQKALWIVKDKLIGILGLSFKPNTDDMREAPSIDIIKMLLKEGAKIKAYDPEAMKKARKILPDITYCSNPYEVAENADTLAIITDWAEFKELDLKKIKSLMNYPIIVDGRNIYDPEVMAKLGFEYISVGRKSIKPF